MTTEDPRITRTLRTIERDLDGLLKRPMMWGPPEAIETAFLILLELKHGIEHVDCQERCGWNVLVNYASKVLKTNSMMYYTLKNRDKIEPERKALHVLTEHLSKIRQLYGQKHPIPWRYEFDDGTVWEEDKSVPPTTQGSIQMSTIKETKGSN